MASPRLTTAGMSLQYAVETVAGTRPTTGYKTIPEIKSMPALNSAPNTQDSTTFAETTYKTYVTALKDLGGSLEYTANMTEDLITFWTTLVSEYESAVDEGKSMWFVVTHPALTKASYFKGEPSPIGFGSAEVDGMLETTLYITPASEPVLEDAPTAVTATAAKYTDKVTV